MGRLKPCAVRPPAGRARLSGLACLHTGLALLWLSAWPAAWAKAGSPDPLPDRELLLFLAEFADEQGELAEPALLDRLDPRPDVDVDAELETTHRPATSHSEAAPPRSPVSRRRATRATGTEHDDEQP